ncbi:MAG: hypothetical protein N2558_01210 [Patescibacteria group bacterium]|nr:hypothetical protein [Patescibacteria group bacterium]
MRFFNKNELLAVGVVLIGVFVFMISNLSIAERKARDAQRRADLGAIADALEKFKEEFGYFPPSMDGAIGACKSESFDEKIDEILSKEPFSQSDYIALLGPCSWGVDGLRDLVDASHKPYLTTIPKDPKTDEGAKYLYLSNLKRYQLYAYLEGGESEIGYDAKIVARDLKCGQHVCSFGKSFSETPLDRSIEDYEAELAEKLKNSN